MDTMILWMLLAIYLGLNLLFVPFQYRYIKAMEEKRKASKSQEEMYNEMTFGELQLHFHNQTNPVLIPANILAVILYYTKKKSL